MDGSGRVVKKSSNIDTEIVGDNIVLLHLSSLETLMLNDFASILWDAIDTYPAEADLILLATEARPSDADSLPKAVQDLLDTLLAKEFLVLA